MFFEKASLRTRLTFEAGHQHLGGNAMFVDQTQSPLGERESLADMARNLERWVAIIVLRTYSHDTITEMAAIRNLPVINALSDLEHPCQALADFMTIEERFGQPRDCVHLRRRRKQRLPLAHAHGRATRSPLHRRHAEKLSPKADIVAKALRNRRTNRGQRRSRERSVGAVTGADAVYTDVCTSMGFEHEATKRAPIFKPYQVNEELMCMRRAARRLHALPAGAP